MSHLDDLKFESHKISEVESMIKEQEWKRLHRSSHNTYSVLVYVCLVLVLYTGWNRRNVPDFGWVFLMLKYTDITQNTYIQS